MLLAILKGKSSAKSSDLFICNPLPPEEWINKNRSPESVWTSSKNYKDMFFFWKALDKSKTPHAFTFPPIGPHMGLIVKMPHCSSTVWSWPRFRAKSSLSACQLIFTFFFRATLSLENRNLTQVKTLLCKPQSSRGKALPSARYGTDLRVKILCELWFCLNLKH